MSKHLSKGVKQAQHTTIPLGDNGSVLGLLFYIFLFIG